jgi:hypothetical protein
MKRIVIKKGDVFFAKISDTKKKYFQYIADDLSQLNSYVIRGFKKEYEINDNPSIESIVSDEIIFYAHSFLRTGHKLGFWTKVGTYPYNDKPYIIFRGTNDIVRKPSEELVKISDKWYIWEINGERKKIGKLTEEYKKAFYGIVYNPMDIIELLKGNNNPANYPD